MQPTVEDYDSSASLLSRNDVERAESVIAAQDRTPRPYRRSRSASRPHASRTHTLPQVVEVPDHSQNAAFFPGTDEQPTLPPRDNPFMPQQGPFSPLHNSLSPGQPQHNPFVHTQHFSPPITTRYQYPSMGGTPQQHMTPHQYNPRPAPPNLYSYFGAPGPQPAGYSYPYSPDPYAPQSTPRIHSRRELYGGPYTAAPTTYHSPFAQPHGSYTPNVPPLQHVRRQSEPERQQAAIFRFQRDELPAEDEEEEETREERRRRRAEARKAQEQRELKARQKRELNKLQREMEAKAKAYDDSLLRKQKRKEQRAQLNNSTPHSDNGTRPNKDTSISASVAKKMEEALKHQDNTRDVEPDRILDDLALFVEGLKKQSTGKSRGTKSNVSRANSYRSGVSSIHSLATDPNLQNEVRDVLLALELIKNMRLEDEESEMMALPAAGETSGEQRDSPNDNDVQDKPGHSRPRIRVDPAPARGDGGVDYLQVPGRSSQQSANTQRTRPSLQRRQGEYSQRASPVGEETDDVPPMMSPTANDSGYTSPQSPVLERVKSSSSRPRSRSQHEEQRLRRSSTANAAPDEPTLQRTRSHGRRPAHPEAFRGILSSDESEYSGRTARGSTPHTSNRGQARTETRFMHLAPDVPTDS